MAQETPMPRVAVLDDYQKIALRMADWSGLPAGFEVSVLDDHVSEPAALARRLADFEVVCIIRERTPFPHAVFERLPKLRLKIGREYVCTPVMHAHVVCRILLDKQTYSKH